MEIDVLIVAARPIGLALALELGMQGHRRLEGKRAHRAGHAPCAKTSNMRCQAQFLRWRHSEQTCRSLAKKSPPRANKFLSSVRSV